LSHDASGESDHRDDSGADDHRAAGGLAVGDAYRPGNWPHDRSFRLHPMAWPRAIWGMEFARSTGIETFDRSQASLEPFETACLSNIAEIVAVLGSRRAAILTLSHHRRKALGATPKARRKRRGEIRGILIGATPLAKRTGRAAAIPCWAGSGLSSIEMIEAVRS
jgi:hypothetical protein